jgi:hypothetical protein
MIADDDTYTDDNGTVWTRPTAWAYAMVCKARDDWQKVAQQEFGMKVPIRSGWTPTHRHAGGGLYRLEGKGRMKVGQDWVPGVAYTNEDHELFMTTQSRFTSRFTALDKASEGQEDVQQDDPDDHSED